MKWTIASIATAVVLVVAGSSDAFFGRGGGVCDGSGNCGGVCNGGAGANCDYGYSLWEGYCSGGGCGGGGCGGGCATGGAACCPAPSTGGGWWYGGGAGCGCARVRGHNCATTNSFGWGLFGGFQSGCCGCVGGFDHLATAPLGIFNHRNNCGCQGCASECGNSSWFGGGCGCGCGSLGGFGSQLQSMAARLRNRMACQSWIGGGLLDPYGLSNGFCDSGFDYGYINQWNAQPQPAPGNEPQPMTTYDSSGAGCDQGTTLEEAPAAASNDTFYESSELDEVPESPDFEN